MAQQGIGFIGAGNMGGALVAAVCKSVEPSAVLVADKNADRAKQVAKAYHCVATDVTDVVAKSRYIFLAVKPQVLEAVACEIRPLLAQRCERVILVSMLAGVTTERLNGAFGQEIPIIRIMPNTPAAIGEGMILYTSNELVTEVELDEFTQVLSAAGRFERLPEQLIDAGSALSGCGPAFVYLFIEALADAGVQCGLPRDTALLLASQTVCGAGKMSVVSGCHPAALKDAVCSPGGSTIEGVHALEDGAFRGVVMDAVEAAFNRTKQLGK